jgi:hypothetical protein
MKMAFVLQQKFANWLLVAVCIISDGMVKTAMLPLNGIM